MNEQNLKTPGLSSAQGLAILVHHKSTKILKPEVVSAKMKRSITWADQIHFPSKKNPYSKQKESILRSHYITSTTPESMHRD